MVQSGTLRAKATRERVGFWDGDLGYRQATAVVVAALAIGVVFHYGIGYGNKAAVGLLLPVYASILGFMLILGRVARTHRVIHWLTGIPFAVTSTLAVGGLAIVGGVFHTDTIQKTTGAPSMWESWPFLMALYLMMLNLIGSVGKRAWPLNYANVVYQASHLGLAITIGGGALSSMALERNVMVLYTGRPNEIAIDGQEREFQMPFQLTLREFKMETFAPTFAFAQEDKKAKDGVKVVPGSAFAKAGMKETIAGYQIVVEKYLDKAVLVGEEWRAVPWKTAAPAALIKATGPDGKVRRGWVSCGSVETSGAFLEVGKNQVILMPELRPKKFASTVEIREGNRKETVEIEVNKKAQVAGYDLYQLSYDDKLGAASPYSVIEVVRDRGIPVVYAGMILMLCGAVLHLWNGVGGKK